MPTAIHAQSLSKTYRTRIKDEGLSGAIKALVKPRYREVKAVDNIDLHISKGELVAFIGPNGAGKSTFIKMLCGILYPTSGEVSVLGYSPVKDRQRLAMHIGTVFGHKSQLWLHLPAVDSFTLLGAIYEIERTTLKKRVAELSERFSLESFLDIPVRKLSLGQRIRCEVAASLLHEPELLFLDEPTIGLDVVAKQAIRELVLTLNKEKGTTVFLTSHDPADIERLCERAVVIDNGRVVMDSPVEQMAKGYLGSKMVNISFSVPMVVPAMPGVEVATGDGGLSASLSVNTNLVPIAKVMEQLAALSMGGVTDITIADPPMEEIIAAIFKSQEGGANNGQ
ncbi:MAG: ATP-binding cassette domain-containing protein [Eubacteriaceae bacterium]|nr:ATP-binding cassette domain-containing protein [Eubacteriaceae bacterium]